MLFTGFLTGDPPRFALKVFAAQYRCFTISADLIPIAINHVVSFGKGHFAHFFGQAVGVPAERLLILVSGWPDTHGALVLNTGEARLGKALAIGQRCL